MFYMVKFLEAYIFLIFNVTYATRVLDDHIIDMTFNQYNVAH